MAKKHAPRTNLVSDSTNDPKWIEDRYKIIKRLGTGGSSKVYLAIDKGDSREPEVALKLLGQFPDSESLQRELFDRELNALSTLSHPRIVRLLDYGDAKEIDSPYLVLEYIEGAKTLQERVPQWKPDLHSAIDLVVEILQALAYAHDANIIHRDLNPNNILMDANGYAKIIDFGISKILGDLNERQTVRDLFTRAYASPEQIAQDNVSYASDIYSVAAIFYFLSTRKDPDPRLPLGQLFDEIHDLHVDVRQILRQMADPSPAQRNADAHELVRELSGVLNLLDSERNRIFVALSRRVITDLYDQVIISSQSAAEAKTVIQAALDSGVFLQRPKDNATGRYELLGDSFILECVINSSPNLGTYSHLYVQHVTTRVSPHRMEKLKQQAMSLNATWLVGMENDAVPTRISSIEGLLDDLAEHERLKSIQIARARRRADLIETWRGILQIDFELQRKHLLQLEYNTLELVEQGHLLKVHLTHETAIDELLDSEQLITLSALRGQPVAVGHYLRHEGNYVFLTRRPNVKPDFLATKGQLSVDQRQWAAAWNRQRHALDAIMEERCVNPNLPDILIDPTQGRKLVSESITHFFNPDLDDAKKQVVNSALTAGDIYLIQGPPGTGKTVVISEIIAQVLEHDPKARILLVSQSNVAVDNVVGRVGELLNQSRMVRLGRDDQISIDAEKYRLNDQVVAWTAQVEKRCREFLARNKKNSTTRRDLEEMLARVQDLRSRLGKQPQTNVAVAFLEGELAELRKRFPQISIGITHKSLQDLETVIHDQINLEKSELERVVEDWILKVRTFELVEDSYLQACSIVAGTCVGIAGNRNLPDAFDFVIIDEAGRATPSEILIPMVRGRRSILVGDHKQLPPVLEHDVKNEIRKREEYDAIWTEMSLFEYLFDRVPDELKSILRTQYRMHPHIAHLIRDVFYREEQLETGVSPEEREHGWKRWPRKVVWYSTGNLENRFEGTVSTSYYNPCEVSIIAHQLADLERDLRERQLKKTVGVIGGYSAQVEELERELNPQNAKRWQAIQVEINTVDAFQGREVDILFYSVVRSNKKKNIGFLRDIRRLNVALSRGKELLFIVGDHYTAFDAFSTDGPNPFKEVIAHIQAHPSECMLVEEAHNDSSVS